MDVTFIPLSVTGAVGVMEIPSAYEEVESGIRTRSRAGTRSLIIRPETATADDWLIWEGFTAIGCKYPCGGCIDA